MNENKLALNPCLNANSGERLIGVVFSLHVIFSKVHVKPYLVTRTDAEEFFQKSW